MEKGRRVFVVGVGMTKFEKPGKRDDFDYPQMALEAGTKALDDAGLRYSDIEQACVGYVYGDTTCGQRVLYQFGITGIPIYNVNNACATGSTALYMAKNLIKGGLADCVMAIGFEKMQRGSLSSTFSDRINPMDKHVGVLIDKYGLDNAPITPQMFGNAGREHMEKYGTKPEHFAKVAWKNHKHSKNNPYAQFQIEYSLEEIMKSPSVYSPLTKLQCCPTSDGSACAIVVSEDFVRKHGLEKQAVEIVAMEMGTDQPSVFHDKSIMKMVGFDMTERVANKVFSQAGLTPSDIQVAEVHDCFSSNELITYEALGLCKKGEAGAFIDQGDNTYGGKYVINPSGGLISKGHPLGATGLAQCAELCWQLRGLAGKRQVSKATIGLQHNLGLGGAVVISLYKMGFPEANSQRIQAIQTSSSKESDFKSAVAFGLIGKAIEEDGATIVKKMKGVYNFKVKSTSGQECNWIVDVKNGSGGVRFNSKDKADTTITLSDEDLVKLMEGKLNPQTAFFQGKIKIAGNMALAMKLKDIMPKPGSKL